MDKDVIRHHQKIVQFPFRVCRFALPKIGIKTIPEFQNNLFNFKSLFCHQPRNEYKSNSLLLFISPKVITCKSHRSISSLFYSGKCQKPQNIIQFNRKSEQASGEGTRKETKMPLLMVYKE